MALVASNQSVKDEGHDPNDMGGAPAERSRRAAIRRVLHGFIRARYGLWSLGVQKARVSSDVLDTP